MLNFASLGELHAHHCNEGRAVTPVQSVSRTRLQPPVGSACDAGARGRYRHQTGLEPRHAKGCAGCRRLSSISIGHRTACHPFLFCRTDLSSKGLCCAQPQRPTKYCAVQGPATCRSKTPTDLRWLLTSKQLRQSVCRSQRASCCVRTRWRNRDLMSGYGPCRTCRSKPTMSAAEAERTCRSGGPTSGFDPTRTWSPIAKQCSVDARAGVLACPGAAQGTAIYRSRRL
jgi:hypothetical protein